MSSLVVIVLAAGEGKRMRSPLPKVLHLCGGKPMLVRVIETIRRLDPAKIVVVGGRHISLLLQTLEDWIDCNGIVFVRQHIPMGTGHAVRCCEHEFTSDQSVLVVNGDTPLLGHTLLQKVVFHTRDVDGTVLTANLENPHGYGRIIYHGDAFVKIVEEKDCTPEQRNIREVNSGVYVFKGYVLHECLPMLTNDNQQQEYYLTDVVRHAQNYHIRTFRIEEDGHERNIQVRGVNTPQELEELDILETEAPTI